MRRPSLVCPQGLTTAGRTSARREEPSVLLCIMVGNAPQAPIKGMEDTPNQNIFFHISERKTVPFMFDTVPRYLR